VATDEELLDIVLQIRATGQAEAEAVNQILANTGTIATSTATQVGGLTTAHKEHADVLQTVSGYTTTYGGALTAQEEHYAKLQLSSKEFATAERDITSEASNAARAMGAMGSEGAHVLDRFAALGGVMGSGGALGIGIGAALIGGGAVVEMGKSMVDNAGKQEEAQRNLAAAYASLGKEVPTAAIDAFITDNERLLPNMYETENAFASLARAGFSMSDQYRLINDAIDLAAAKHIDLTTATNDLILAHNGQTRALGDLGIAIKEVVNPQKDLEKAQREATIASKEKAAADRALYEETIRLRDQGYAPTESQLFRLQDLRARDTDATLKNKTAQQELQVAQGEVNAGGNQFNEILAQLEPKIKGSRGDVSDLAQAHNKLSIEWERLSNQNGPALEGALADITGGVADMLQTMRTSDSGGDSGWAHMDAGIIYWGSLVKDAIGWIGDLGSAWDDLVRKVGGTTSGSFRPGPHGPVYSDTSPGPGPSSQPVPGYNVNTYIYGVTDPQAAARAAQRAIQGALRT